MGSSASPFRCCFCISSFLLSFTYAQHHPTGAYYGLPLGSIQYSGDATHAKIYAADDSNLMLVNFRHKPRQPGCTTFMVGPPRADEENLVEDGAGVLLAIKQPLIAHGRKRRNVNLNAFYNWPFELDQLRAPEPTSGFESRQNEDPFAGIELDVSGDDPFEPTPKPMPPRVRNRFGSATTNRRGRPISGMPSTVAPRRKTTRKIVWTTKRPKTTAPTTAKPKTSTRKPATKPSTTRSSTRNSSSKKTDTTRSKPTEESSSTTSSIESTKVTVTSEQTQASDVDFKVQQFIAPVSRRPRVKTTSEAQSDGTTKIFWEAQGTEKDSEVTAPSSASGPGLVFVDENGAERTDFDFDSDDADLGAALERIEQERRLSRRRKQKAKTSKADEKTTAGPGLVVVDDIGEGIIVGDPNDPNFRRPTNVNPRFFGPLPRAHEIRPVQTVEETNNVAETEENSLRADVSAEDGYTAVLGANPPVTLPPRLLKYLGADEEADDRRRTTDDSKKPLVFILGRSHGSNSDQDENEDDEEATWSPTWTVAPKVGYEHPSGLFKVIEDPRAKRRQLAAKRREEFEAYKRQPVTEKSTTTTTTHAPISDEFVLPTVDDRMLTISMPPGATLNDYQWFGVYDRCRKVRTGYVSLVDVVAPSEKVIDPIVGWSHNVSSKPVRILNCDTLLIPKFTFTGGSGRPTNSHFYVGIGDFPSYVVQQVRAYVVGVSEPSRPLRDYHEEDVVVRLPEGWNTFDVNFLSIYSDSDQQAYGHTQIPPVIVPPCDDM